MQSPQLAQTTPLTGFSISPQQQRVLGLDAALNVYPYIAQAVLFLDCNLDLGWLEKALHGLVNKYEILRTRFLPASDSQTYLQVIMAESPVSIVSHCSTDSETPRGGFSRASEFGTIDLNEGCILHCTVGKSADERTMIVITMPAVCGDARSLRTMIAEVIALYDSADPGKSSEKESAQYADIAEYFRDSFNNDAGVLGQQYWRSHMASLQSPQLKATAIAYPRNSFDPQAADENISEEALFRARQHLGSEWSSEEIFLLACWQSLLLRLSGQGEFTIGYAADGRELLEMQEAVGLFERYIPLQFKCTGDTQFSEALKATRETIEEARRWQSAFQWTTSDGYHPICFSYYECICDVSAKGTRFTCSSVSVCSDKFDLKMACTRTSSGLIATIWYNPAIYTKNHARRLASQFRTLVESASDLKEIGSLNMMSNSERRRLLEECGNNHETNGETADVITTFKKQVALHPERVALVRGQEHLSYAELNHRSNQLAHYLQMSDVGPEELVGVCMGRSIEMIISLVAIWKAGGAYVPFDPDLPPKRVAYMLADAKPKLVLTLDHLAQHLRSHEIRLAPLDSMWAMIAAQDCGGDSPELHGESLAYVIYTSGTTGSPKGVAVNRKGVSNYVTWASRAYGYREGGKTPLYSSVSFDLSVTAIWPVLATAGCVMLVPEDEGVAWFETPHAAYQSYDVIKVTPAHLRFMRPICETSAGESCCMIVGGEALLWDHFKHWEKRKNVTVVNEYGPTETVVGSCIFELNQEWMETGTVPIGRPIINTSVYVMNGSELAPFGVIGELCIAGAGLARGYLNQPALTAERFVPNPFSTKCGERLYRTGDRARWADNDTLEFLGREDGQVKVHGYRIELGEIEKVLRQHPDVRDAVVLANQNVSEDKRLIGYVAGQRALAPSELRAHLMERLPEYMVPSIFVQLDKFPLAHSGKVDRQALPAPGMAARKPYVAPQNSVEQTLADIWMGILKKERIGRDDNFFEMGGDSILSLQAVARAKRAGLRLTPKQIFEYQTIAELALHANCKVQPEAEQDAVTGEIPLLPIQRWFFENVNVERHHFNQSVLLSLTHKPEQTRLEMVLNLLLEHHDALRLRFKHEDGEWRQWIEPKENVNRVLVRLDFREVKADLAKRLEESANQWQSSLNLETGPLVRFIWFACDDSCNDLLLCIIHHLAVDGISWRILLEDLETLLVAPLDHLKTALLPKTASFQKWSKAISQQMSLGLSAAEKSYWHRIEASMVPYEGILRGNSNNSPGIVTVALSAQSTHDLLSVLPSVFHSHIHDVFLAAMAEIMMRYTGLRRAVIDLEGHGREDTKGDLDVSRTVGWFTIVYPVLIEVPVGADIGQRVKLVKEQLRAVPAKGAGYGFLRYADRNKSFGSRQSKICFNYLGQFSEDLQRNTAFILPPQLTGNSHAREQSSEYLLQINARVTGGRLQMKWNYGPICDARIVEGMATELISELEKIIRYCCSLQISGHTPADFPLADIDQATIDLLAQKHRLRKS